MAFLSTEYSTDAIRVAIAMIVWAVMLVGTTDPNETPIIGDYHSANPSVDHIKGQCRSTDELSSTRYVRSEPEENS